MQAASAGRKVAHGDKSSVYVSGAMQAEADTWKRLAYVRSLLPEEEKMHGWALRAYLTSMRLHMELGQTKELLVLLVDVARWSFAQQNVSLAHSLLIKAERVLPYVGGEKDLGYASILKYLGELQTEVHLANPNGWNAAADGKQEDMTLALYAIEKLKMAEGVFVAKSADIPGGVLSSVRFSLSRSTLLAGRFQESKDYLKAILEDAHWKASNPREAEQAQQMLDRLEGKKETNPNNPPPNRRRPTASTSS